VSRDVGFEDGLDGGLGVVGHFAYCFAIRLSGF